MYVFFFFELLGQVIIIIIQLIINYEQYKSCMYAYTRGAVSVEFELGRPILKRAWIYFSRYIMLEPYEVERA